MPSTLDPSGSIKVTKNEENNNENENKDKNEIISIEKDWYKHMWLSNIDLFRLFECAISNPITYNENRESMPFKNYTIVNGVSNNIGMRWCLQNDIGYKPVLNVNEFDETKYNQTNQNNNISENQKQKQN